MSAYITPALGSLLGLVTVPAPDVLPLPAPSLVMHILLLLTFLLHVLAMNAMLGGLLLTWWLRVRAKGPDDTLRKTADRMSKVSPTLVAATVTLGVAPLLFMQVLMGQFFFTSSIVMGWGWFSVVPVLILAYYGIYLQSFRGARLGAAQLPLLTLTGLLFLWIAFMFSNNTSLMISVGAWTDKYFASAGGLHLNLSEPTLWPRYLHMVLGAVAVAGLMLAWWGRIRIKHGDQTGVVMGTVGLNAFTGMTFINVLVGLWYFLALDRPVRKLFMGGEALGSALLTVGLILGVLMVLLGWRSGRSGARRSLWPLTVITLLQLVGMILMRDIARSGYLAEHYRPEDFVVATQSLNLALFFVLLIAAVGIIVWMIRKLQQHWE